MKHNPFFILYISSGLFSFNPILQPAQEQHQQQQHWHVVKYRTVDGIKKYSALNLTPIIAVHGCFKQSHLLAAVSVPFISVAYHFQLGIFIHSKVYDVFLFFCATTFVFVTKPNDL